MSNILISFKKPFPALCDFVSYNHLSEHCEITVSYTDKQTDRFIYLIKDYNNTLIM